MSAILLILSLSACKGPGPCLDACRDDASFFDACYETLLTEYHVAISCYEDADELGEALAAAGTDDEAREAVYSEWLDADKHHFCEDAAEVNAQCKSLTRAEFRYLESDDKVDRREECIADDPDDEEIRQAMDDEDCEAFAEALGVL